MKLFLAIPTMGIGELHECLYTADYEHSGINKLDVLLWLNGCYVETDFETSSTNYRIKGSQHNIGVVAALQGLYELSKEVAPEGDLLLAYIHDDVLFEDDNKAWDLVVRNAFTANPKLGLAGFHGAKWLGQPHIYKAEYELIQLARGGCISNMKDAEHHGVRSTEAQRVACVDGFSLVCRRSFLDQIGGWSWFPKDIPHHVYDTALACMAARHGWETWFLPVAVHHLGGRTATKVDFTAQFGRSEGEIHSAAHAWMYEEFKDILPLRVNE